ncbi:MAG: lipoate--protein ligase family protein, partial [Candidatus Omnitrophica bacterium]|nr:lipoate--protein ligase family protein [Candidatus Omnitrophota bacterium]
MKTIRFINSGAGNPYYNMALDETLFENCLSTGKASLRLYTWDSPAFSVGVSQNIRNEIVLDACRRDNIQVVRRITGGGVLFHHDEITYSFFCAKEDIKESDNIVVSYRNICGFLMRFYLRLGLKAGFSCELPDFERLHTSSPICGASHEKYDIMIHGRKIGGNAQKRRGRIIFQHGIIPVRLHWETARKYLVRCPESPAFNVTALDKEMAFVPPSEYLERELVRAFEESFGIRCVDEALSQEEEKKCR